jgi:hypothetical protein
VKPTNDLAQISQNAGVPENLQGCHTMFVENYVVDGHVPVGAIRKLLFERPNIAGITLPGMPEGSPGMTGRKSGPFIPRSPRTAQRRRSTRRCDESSGPCVADAFWKKPTFRVAPSRRVSGLALEDVPFQTSNCDIL